MTSSRFRSAGVLIGWVLLALIVSIAPPLSAQTARWLPLGPFGGTVSSLASHPTDPRGLYGVTSRGFIRSTDSGASWQLALPWTDPLSVALDPTRPATMYALLLGFPSRVFRSADGGIHWMVVSRNLPPDLFGTSVLTVDLARPSRLYLGTQAQGLWRSLDGGVTWKAVNQGIGAGGNSSITALVAVKRPAGTAFAGTRNGGVFRTVNGGDSWSPVRQGLPSTDVRTLAVAPSDPRTLYASFAQGNLYRSFDGGASWNPAGHPSPRGVSITALAIHPRERRTVYAGTVGAGVFKTTDGGTHWTSTGVSPAVRVLALALDSTASATVYAGAEGLTPSHPGTDVGGVLRSADGGASWTRVNRGITGLGALSAAIDPADPESLVVGMLGPGLFRSANGGTRWVRTPAGFPSPGNLGVVIPEVLVTSPGVFYAVDPGHELLWKSTDGGFTWGSLPGPRSTVPEVPGRIVFLRGDPFEPETLYAMLFSGLQRSVDGGASWTPLTGPPALCRMFDLAVGRDSASVPPIFYAVGARPGLSGSCGIFDRVGVFRNADGAGSWTDAYAGLAEGSSREAAAVVVDPRNPRTVLVGTGPGFSGVHEGVWRSTDSGASWRQVGLNGHFIRALAASPVPGVFWAATSNQVFRSDDDGATWRDWSGGPVRSVEGFAFDPLDPRRVYAPSSDGVWVLEGGP